MDYIALLKLFNGIKCNQASQEFTQNESTRPNKCRW